MYFDLYVVLFEDNWFDVIFCNYVLEYVDDVLQCMCEFYWVFKFGGWVIMQVLQDINWEEIYEDWFIILFEECELYFWQKDYVWFFGCDYLDWLCKVGFEVLDGFNFVNLFEVEIKCYCLLEFELFYIVWKK